MSARGWCCCYYVCDVNLPSSTTIRVGIVGEQAGFGGVGGGIQYDLMKKSVGEFINQRLLP